MDDDRGLPIPVSADDSDPEPSLPLFVYGSLEDDRFVALLLERELTVEVARLQDHRVLDMEGAGVPIVLPAEGETVLGRLYRGLSSEDMRRLDAYQGVGEGLFRRLGLQVVASGAEVAESAWVYIPTDRMASRVTRQRRGDGRDHDA
jgi:gamma-glutamylcyclotransferase (GGCT)/AIG2-like uncharacterized protein YtfP